MSAIPSSATPYTDMGYPPDFLEPCHHCGKRLCDHYEGACIMLFEGHKHHPQCVDEIKEKRGELALIDCVECGLRFNPDRWMTKEKLRNLGECHTCNFWLDLIRVSGDKQWARIGGNHYQLHDYGRPVSGGDSRFKGSAGRCFTVRFTDAREPAEIETRDLWCQGRIPERFRDRLPDNAEWVGGQF